MARPEKRNTAATPSSRPTRTFGNDTLKENAAWVRVLEAVSARTPPASLAASTHELLYEPNRALAASTAVAIAIPLVIALVVLPTASSSVRIWPPSAWTSPDISAMPWALSETGPNVSIATITPTVVSRPQPASDTAARAIVTLPPPIRNAPNTAAAMTSVV